MQCNPHIAFLQARFSHGSRNSVGSVLFGLFRPPTCLLLSVQWVASDSNLV